MIYLDSAATAHKRPDEVAQQLCEYLQTGVANPGRGAYFLANNSARKLYTARVSIAEFFHASNPLNVVFTSGITESLNLILKGMLVSGDHVVTSNVEHNAIMRPLRSLEKSGVEISTVSVDEEGFITPDEIEMLIKSHTKLVVLNHASNVSGALQPIKEIGHICRKKGCLLLVDTAQSAGCVPINMEDMAIDILAFTGHKGLMGPMGTGGFILADHVNPMHINPLIEGGTGSNSEEEIQPVYMPDRFESGTHNLPGIVGLHAAVSYLLREGVESVFLKELSLIQKLREGLQTIAGVRLYGPDSTVDQRVAVLSFTIDGMDNGEVAARLESEFCILCRVGLHCAPAAHKSQGTYPNGTIRFSLNYFLTIEDVDFVIESVRKLVSGEGCI